MTQPNTNKKEIWVILEQERGELSRLSTEVLSGGRKLAEKSSSLLAAVYCGDNIESITQSACRFGVNKFYLGKNFSEDYVQHARIARVLGEQILNFSPFLVLFGDTQKGQDLSLRVSSNLTLPLFPHCEALEIKSDYQITASRPSYNGNFSIESVSLGKKPTLASVIPRKWNPEPVKSPVVSPELINFSESSENQFLPPFEILEIKKIDLQDMDLSNADIVVGGGKGVGSAENFQYIENLARVLNGVSGGSRVAVCNGWVPFDRQIGQSGKTIAPRLYIACGISGAIHHQMGIKDAELIMAINTDKNAPIFKLADVGVVSDVNGILPDIIQRLTAVKEEQDKK